MKTLIGLILSVACVATAQMQSSGADATQKRLIVSVDSVYGEGHSGTYSIIGTVIDQSSREPIEGATVSLLGTSYTAKSSPSGQYTFSSVPEGIYQMKAEAAAYEPQIINNVLVNRDRPSQRIFFTLQQSSQEPPPDFVQVEKQPQPISGSAQAPVYPELARLAGVEGTVWVKIWVDENGTVKNAVVLRSDAEIFNQASIDAAMKWKFSPAILKGKPVAVWVTVPFKFRLNNDVVASNELDKIPKPLKKVYPQYPPDAKKLNLQGTFFIETIVNKKGAVSNAYVKHLRLTDSKLHNDTLLEDLRKKLPKEEFSAVLSMSDYAIKAVRKWRFSPGMKKKHAVVTKVIIPVKYSLSDSKKGSKK